LKHLILGLNSRVKFECIRCGKCCTTGPNVALTVFDICRIARYLGVDWKSLRGRYIIAYIADMIPVPALIGIAGRCVFLEYHDETPTCSIYPVRPMRCRLYPFQPISPSDPTRIQIHLECPGVGKGLEVDPPWNTLREYYEELKKHYSLLYDLIFNKGFEPLEALEKLLDETCESTSNVQ